VESFPVSHYVRRIKPRVADLLARPAVSRLLWLPVHVSVIVFATLAIARGWVPFPVVPVLSIVIGLSFGGLMFLGHETMHGGVLRGRWGWAKSLVGTVCFAPLLLSPRLWQSWHNRKHHANGNRIGIDPDMYPSLTAYERSATTRFAMDNFALGGRRWRGLFSIVIGFTVQSTEILISARKGLGLSARDHRVAIAGTVMAYALWVALAFVIGPFAFLFAFAIPHVIANAVVMSFIVTNHGLSPASDTNDPLVGSLSVTGPRWLEWLTLDFGYHVEHHLFPAASTRHGRAIRAELVAEWPERYKSMPIGSALSMLFKTGRVYRDATTLVDPRSGGAWSLVDTLVEPQGRVGKLTVNVVPCPSPGLSMSTTPP
jgi:fatty acid desaturase